MRNIIILMTLLSASLGVFSQLNYREFFENYVKFSGSGAIKVISGTTAERQASPEAGMFRFNTESSSFEGYNGSDWGNVGGTSLDTKGQIQGFDGSDPIAIGPCSDGEFLVYDTTEDSGYKCTDTLSGTLNPVGDWTSFTPNFTGFTIGNGTLTAHKRRVGQNMELVVTVVLGSTSVMSGPLDIDIPDGLLIDSDVVTSDTTDVLGQAQFSGSGRFTGRVEPEGTSKVRIFLDRADLSYVQGTSITSTNPQSWTTGHSFGFTASIPIQGWTSGTDAVVQNKQLVEVKAQRLSTQAIATATNVTLVYNVESIDNMDAYDAPTGVFTSPKEARYLVCAGAFSNSASWSAGQYWQIQANLSVGTEDEYLDRFTAAAAFTNAVYAKGCNYVNMSEGEELSIFVRHTEGSTLGLSANGDFNYLSIKEIPSSSTVVGTFGKCQTKYLSSDITSDTTDIADLRFSNLTIGGRYRLNMRPWVSVGNTDNSVFIYANNGSNRVAGFKAGNTGSGTTGHGSSVLSPVFTATDSTITVDTLSMSSPTTLEGNGTIAETWVEVCESNKSLTTEW